MDYRIVFLVINKTSELDVKKQKGSSFKEITNEEISFIEDRLNKRPRKSLGYMTLNEVYQQYIDA